MDRKEKKQLAEFFKSHNLMSLATSVKNPWVATVYYTFDKDFNIYFVSSPKSKHSQDIEVNPQVACAVYDSHIKNSEPKAGVQLQGKAHQVEGWAKTAVLLKMWHKAAPGMEEVVNIKNMKDKVISSRVYKIEPSLIKFFNQKIYKKGEENKVFKFQ